MSRCNDCVSVNATILSCMDCRILAREECNHSQTAWAADKEYCVFCGALTGQTMIRPQRTDLTSPGLPEFEGFEVEKDTRALSRVEVPPECCGTLVKLWKGAQWVCVVCEKSAIERYHYGSVAPKKCECGSAVCGLTHHSSWCPLYVVP